MSKVKLLGIPLNRKSLVRWKIYLDRARNYLGIINFAMISFVFLNSKKNAQARNLLDENKLIVYPAIMLLFILIALIMGRMDTKLGMRKEEYRNHASENPITMEILNSLREIKVAQKIR
mgnify:CR=1 FL=1